MTLESLEVKKAARLDELSFLWGFFKESVN